MNKDHTHWAIGMGSLMAVLWVFGWTPLFAGQELPGRIFVSNRDSMTVIDPDDDATPGVIRERYDGPGARPRGPGEGCRAIGAYGSTFLGPNRLRGDVVKIDAEFAELNHYLIELDIVMDESVTLFFVIYESITDELEGEYDQWFLDEQLVVGRRRDLYSSGEVALTMRTDRYYVVACAWGDHDITFGHDGLFLPNSFELGTVEARVVIDNPFPLDPDPFFDFDNGFLALGAYSMELCMEPFTGACCSVDDLGDDLCQETFRDNCDFDPDAFFAGELTDCQSIDCPLPIGACCLRKGGGCVDDTTEFDCTVVDGNEYQGDDSLCSDDDDPCVIPTGSCCLGEMCEDLSEVDCAAQVGEYGGDGTFCKADTCVPLGACCLTDACSEVTEEQCDGDFAGDGTECSTDPCSLGACCLGMLCLDDFNQQGCEQFGGVYLGDRSVCDPETSCECTVDADCDDSDLCTSDVCIDASCDHFPVNCPEGETCNPETAQCEVSSCEGDANDDGVVDPLDSGFVLARFGCEVGTGDPDCDTADQNGDGTVDPLDVGFILARFGPC